MSDIIAALEQQRIRKLDRSERYTELREEAARAKGENVKAIVSGNPRTDPSLPTAATTLRMHYYEMLSIYKGGSFAFAKQITKRGVVLWMRVLHAQQASGVSPEKFMRAQFVWFHKAFGKSPAVEQLATEAATERAIEVGGSVTRNIVGNDLAAAVTLADVFRQSEKMVQDIMRAQGCASREDFYRDFILTGVFSLPKKFLAADPAYRKVSE